MKLPETTIKDQSGAAEDHGATYTGEWLKGTKTRQGRGILIRANGERYDGYFKDSKFHGKGKLSFAPNDS